MRHFAIFVLCLFAVAFAGCGGSEERLGPTSPASIDGTDFLPTEPSTLDAGGATASGDEETPVVQPLPWVSGEIVVEFRGPSDVEAFHSKWGTTTILEISGRNFVLMRLPAGRNATGTCMEMLASGDCEGVQPNYVAETPESNQGTVAFYEGEHVFDHVVDQDAMNRIGVDIAHEYASGSGIVVAILDTGIDSTHPDLAGSVSPIGWDFVDEDDNPMDELIGANKDGDDLVDEAAGHGTHVAGLVHAVAPSATLMALRVLNSEGFGTSVNVARAIWFAIEHGADVINMSFGMEGKSDVMRRAIHDAEEEEIFLVASAGNGGRLVEYHYPAKFHDVMAVAATDSRDRRASFSNKGSFVGISAPGVGLLSTYLHHAYAVWSGTSMSVPLVAGAAALYRDRHGRGDLDDVVEEIERSAVPVRESDMGAGRLAVGRMLRD